MLVFLFRMVKMKLKYVNYKIWFNIRWLVFRNKFYFEVEVICVKDIGIIEY